MPCGQGDFLKIQYVISQNILNQRFFAKWSGFILLSSIVFLSVVMPPFHEGPVKLCLFKRAFGMPCPGCGMTRAFIFLGHGSIYEAFKMNPNSFFAFLIVIFIWLNRFSLLFVGREMKVSLRAQEKIFIYVFSALLMSAVWLYNLSLQYQF